MGQKKRTEMIAKVKKTLKKWRKNSKMEKMKRAVLRRRTRREA